MFGFRALATASPAAAAQYEAARTNRATADKVDAETKLKADFLLDCGHIANRPVCFHVSDHRRGNYSATTCPSCPAAGADLAAVCPAAAAQFDAAGSNPPPSTRITARSKLKADFLLDCGHTINRAVDDHVRSHVEAQPSFVESLDSDLVRRTFQGLLKE